MSSRFKDFNFLKSGLECAFCFSKDMIRAAFYRLLFRGSCIEAQAPPQFIVQ